LAGRKGHPTGRVCLWGVWTHGCREKEKDDRQRPSHRQECELKNPARRRGLRGTRDAFSRPAPGHPPPTAAIRQPAGTSLPGTNVRERTAGLPGENRRYAPRYSRGSPLRAARANNGATRYRAEKTDFTSV